MNYGMTLDGPQSDYLLGSSDAEHQRLIRQAMRLAPVTESFLREAGIGPGQHVLDLGSGVGDVAMLVARLVGRSGEVVATAPGVDGAEFVVGSGPKRTLIIRDAQHEYLFEER